MDPLLASSFSFSLGPVVLIVLGLTVVALVVLAVMVVLLGTKLKNITYPVYDRVIKEAQVKANRIIEEAEEQNRAMRARAQMEAGKALADRKKEDEELRKVHIARVEEVTNHAKEILEKQAATVHQLSESVAVEFKTYADKARALIGQETDSVQKTMEAEKQRMTEALTAMNATVEKGYHELVEDTKRQVSEEVAKEIDAARTAIKEYRKGRMEILNREIVGLVEDTARIALNKALSLKEHEGLVEGALEEAKREGIFE